MKRLMLFVYKNICMNQELEERLVEDYPEFFEYYNADMEPPAPQINLFGFECGDGWYDIIDGLCQSISNLGVSVTVVQVKEKFGGLRFYYEGVSSDKEERVYMVHGAVQMAEEMSYRTCENCGESGELRDEEGWYKTRCDSCFEE